MTALIDGDFCPCCFDGHLVRTLGTGRTVDDIRGPFEVPASFPLLKCDRCGDITQSLEEARKLADLKADYFCRL